VEETGVVATQAHHTALETATSKGQDTKKDKLYFKPRKKDMLKLVIELFCMGKDAWQRSKCKGSEASTFS